MEKIVKYEAGAGDWRNTTGTSYLECLVVHDQIFSSMIARRAPLRWVQGYAFLFAFSVLLGNE